MIPPPGLATDTAGARRGRPHWGKRRHGQHLREGPSLCRRRKRGAKAQAIGISRGGRTTKAHLVTDLLGRPTVIHLTPVNVSDMRAAPVLIAEAGRLRRMIADRGYDANALRKTLRSQQTQPIIPGRRSRKRPIRQDERRYKDRWRIEATFCRLKDFRRVATRYDKLATSFLATVAIVALVAFWL